MDLLKQTVKDQKVQIKNIDFDLKKYMGRFGHHQETDQKIVKKGPGKSAMKPKTAKERSEGNLHGGILL